MPQNSEAGYTVDGRTAEKIYIAIDLKSFYASAECAQRGLDPLTTNLVVADAERTEKTICLAVSPSLKSYGISGRARLFEVLQKVDQINAGRRSHAPGRVLTGSSWDNTAVQKDRSLALDFLVATPRMKLYMDISTHIVEIYMRFIAPEDIHVYSIDEVFIDATLYLKTYHCTPRELTMKLIRAVLQETNITATAGIGTNLYLAKVAMDIVAKHIPADRDGVRIAELNEYSYRTRLWDHQPLTDFWRVGSGTARKLAQYQMFTMGDIARCSAAKETDLVNEELLYKLFGVNAELLIDHAWGWEPCTMEDIHHYRPRSSSLSNGQVLSHPYEAEKALLILKEMTDRLVLDLVDKGLVTNQLSLYVSYDNENLKDAARRMSYQGDVCADYYGKAVPKPAHGSVNLESYSSSTREITEAMVALFRSIVDPQLLVRRLNISANALLSRRELARREDEHCEQLSLFIDPAEEEKKASRQVERERELRRQQAILAVQKKYGKNAMLKGMNLQEGATAMERNRQVGGHRA